MPAISDDEIAGDVVSAFAADPNIHAVEIRVRAQDGVVHLQGVVETLDEKTAAERAALRIRGVKRVQNDLTISADKNLSDAEIEGAAREALDADDLAFIGVRVETGSAFLMGVAKSEAVVDRAMEIVPSVSGVRGVYSEIEIEAGDDIGLANDIAEALSDDPRLEFLDLQVRCDEGHAVLTGFILNVDQFDAATEVTESVPGVRSVENRMVLQEARAA